MNASPPARPVRLCRVEDIDDPGARGFELDAGGPLELFVVRVGASVRAWRNRCPHTGVNLNWLPDRFFDAENRWLQCALHGALFEPLSGECIHGPCLRRHLEPLPVAVADGCVWLLPEGERPDTAAPDPCC